MIDQLATQHELALASWKRHKDDENIRMREGDVMADAVAKLLDIHGRFPELMKEAMEFSQLTAGSAEGNSIRAYGCVTVI
jgi:hypothetical protein